MNRKIEEIAADFDRLAPLDFDYNNIDADGWKRLDELCIELLSLNDVVICAPIMFRIMERLDGSDLGSPGPLVHTLEKWPGKYEPFLVDSIRRKPSPLALWMVNRILNTNPENADMWLDLLRSVHEHSAASEATKAEATDFLKYQMEA